MKETKLLHFIKTMRESDGYIRHIYTQGGCYQFYLILKAIYPQAAPYTNAEKTHVATKLFGKLFDIDGRVENEADYSPLQPEDLNRCESWSFYKNMRLRVKECPHCGESICIEGINL